MAIVQELNLIGKQFGNYKIIGELGRGGMAIVYKADELSLNRVVALKVLSPKISDDEEMIQRFQREAQAAAKLNHPNIVHIYSIGKEQGVHYFTMEYIKGRSLRQIGNEEGPLPLSLAVSFITDVALALDEAHKAGLVHRDIKPSNIMIDTAGRVKVTDFGIAHVSEAKTKLTITGTFLGTPEYMSPEQCEAKTVDGRSDIYSLGVTFYEALSGKGPFEAETPASMLVKIMSGDKIPLRVIKPDVPIAIEAVIDKMLQIDREKRYRNCQELVAALRTVASRLPDAGAQTVRESSQQSRVIDLARKEPGQPKRNLLAASAILLVVVALGSAALLIRANQKPATGATPAPSTPMATSTAPETAAQPATPAEPVAATPGTAPTPAVAIGIGKPETPAPAPASLVAPEAPAKAPVAGKDAPAEVKAPESPAPTVLTPAVTPPPVAAPPVVEEPPAANSVLVSASGDDERNALLASWVESFLPKDRFTIVDADAAADKKRSQAARYSIPLTITRMSTRMLEFHGSSTKQFTVALALKVIDTASGKVVAGPFTANAEYTALNMEANLKESLRDLVGKIPADLANPEKP